MRFWVKIPGQDKPIELTLEELADRQRGGKLAAGTIAARFGETAWHPVESIEDLKQAPPPEPAPGLLDAASDAPVRETAPTMPADDAAPPSISAAGAELFDEPLGASPTIAGVTAGQGPGASLSTVLATGAIPPPPPPPRPRRGFNVSRALIAALAAAAVVVISGGALLCAWYRLGYTHGAVFEHLPDDCAVFEYVDFAAIDGSSAVSAVADKRDAGLSDWDDDLDDGEGIRPADGDDGKGRAATLRALKKAGLRPYGDVKEVAFCEVHDESSTETLLVIGGSFRGKDLLSAMRSALLHRDRKAREERLKLDEMDGHASLRLEGNGGEDRYAVMATSQVVMIGPKRLIERQLASHSASRAYAVREGEVIVRHLDADASGKGPIEERYSLSKTQLTFTRIFPGGEADVVTTTSLYKAYGDKVRNIDSLTLLADGYASAQVTHDDGPDVKVEVTWPIGDLAKTVRALLDTDAHHLAPSIDALKGMPGAEYVHHALLPGVDYLELRLRPW